MFVYDLILFISLILVVTGINAEADTSCHSFDDCPWVAHHYRECIEGLCAYRILY
ncbi:putative Late nodulin [Medicago truncatula]|uniref:Nodule-specific cysteine-rich peptide 145 n=1 Tax=Medicago truncatula TaxID=3880 RepID=A7KHA2_MEDTR|nr:nodule-specific cysteine-rich peptide 145 [Medicago truncatula]AFK39535.1 unknown [Medicago truncatula]RHN60799.1 putative Late nodulin [Medicago truncatula]